MAKAKDKSKDKEFIHDRGEEPTTVHPLSGKGASPRTPGEDKNFDDPERAAAPPEATNYEHPSHPGEHKAVPGEGITDAGIRRSGPKRTKKAPLMAPGALHADTTFSPQTAEDTQRGVTGEGGALNTDAGPGNPPPVESEPEVPASVAGPGVAPVASMQTLPHGPDRAIPRGEQQTLCVRDVMSQTLEVCNPDTELDYVARMMADRDCGAIPVVEDTDTMKPVGIITDRDIVVRIIARGESPADRQARDCMSTNLLCVKPQDTLRHAIEELEQHQLRRALVVDDGGHLCGILATADIARRASREESAELIKDVSAPTHQEGMYH